jgi:tripartite-type tricarboxylate transporter receptor subunit TctC
MNLLRALSFLAVGFACCAAHAQSYPQKPIRLIIGFSAGSGGDAFIRLTAAKASQTLGQPIVVENQGGGGGVLAAQTVARAAPDGYTMMVQTAAPIVLRPFIVATPMPYDPVKDFTPITQAIEAVLALVANPSLPVNSLKELIDYAKRNPGLAYGTNGVGSTFQLIAEQIQLLTGIHLTHVPYKGVANAVKDLIGGQIPLSFAAYGSALPAVNAGKAKFIFVVARQRVRSRPDVPTIAESLPGYRPIPGWLSFFGPAKLPAPVLGRLSGDLIKALHLPEVGEKAESVGFAVVASTPEEFRASLHDDIQTVAKLVKAAGIKPR